MLFFALKTSSVRLKCGSLRTVANKVTLPRCILNAVPSLMPPLRLEAQTSVHVCGSDAVLDSLSFQITAPCCIKHKSTSNCYDYFPTQGLRPRIFVITERVQLEWSLIRVIITQEIIITATVNIYIIISRVSVTLLKKLLQNTYR